ncbi:hypothetical protein D6C82_00162 [Aureobasidium pullulans]|nr:hypothetical protein D6D26_01915 [Aureobasidium pullulans]TIA05267.1 hypothetical protein D6C82_00162 [Aureobasidium pullulans]
MVGARIRVNPFRLLPRPAQGDMCAQYLEQQDAQVLNRKRFDSVAMTSRHDHQSTESDFTTSRTSSWQQQPSEEGLSICETGRQRAAERPAGLPFDCWNSPLCPRNMPQNGSARSAGQTVCNPSTSLSNNTSACQTTTDATTASPNDTPTTEISIPADSPPFDARPSLKRARTDTAYDTADEPPPVKPAPKEKRLPHHVIERRYRENLNTQIEQLRAAVPSTTSPCLNLDMEDIGPTYASASASQNNAAANNSGIRPLSKAGVIAHAAEYMRQLSTQNDEVERRNAELRMTVEALRRLVNCEGCGVVQQLIDAGS